MLIQLCDTAIIAGCLGWMAYSKASQRTILYFGTLTAVICAIALQYSLLFASEVALLVATVIVNDNIICGLHIIRAVQLLLQHNLGYLAILHLALAWKCSSLKLNPLIIKEVCFLSFFDALNASKKDKVMDLKLDQYQYISSMLSRYHRISQQKYSVLRAVIRMAWIPLIGYGAATICVQFIEHYNKMVLLKIVALFGTGDLSTFWSLLGLWIILSVANKLDLYIEHGIDYTYRVIHNAIEIDLISSFLQKKFKHISINGLISDIRQYRMDLGDLVNTITGATLQLFNAYSIMQSIGYSTMLITLVSSAAIAYVKRQTNYEGYTNYDDDNEISFKENAFELLKNMRTIKQYSWETKLLNSVNYLFDFRKQDNSYIYSRIIKYTPKIANLLAIYNIACVKGEISYIEMAALIYKVNSLLNYSLKLYNVYDYVVGINKFESRITTLEATAAKFITNKDINGDIAVSLTDCCFSWADYKLTAGLQIKHGEFVTVTGKVGSGKSSLISAIGGEMPLVSGQATVYGNISYVSQRPWIMNATFRDNVLFGNKYDQSKYAQVIYACALVDDIQMFPAGDMTEIGHLGINLSGGQKARLALARAIYNDGDIFLLDDVLSAVDANVEQHLIKHVLTGILANKTTILVTHAEHVIPLSNRNITMDNGKLTISASSKIESYPSQPNINSIPTPDIPTPANLDAAAFKLDVHKPQSSYTLVYKFVALCGLGVTAAGLAIELFRVYSNRYLDAKQSQLIANNATLMNVSTITRYLILDFLLFVADNELESLHDWYKANIWNSASLTKLRKQLLYKLVFAKLTFYERLSYSSITEVFDNNSRMIAYGLSLSLGHVAFMSFKAMSSVIATYQVSPIMLLVTGIAAYPVAQLCKLKRSIDLENHLAVNYRAEERDLKAEIIDGYQVIRIHKKTTAFISSLQDKIVNCIQLSSIDTRKFYMLIDCLVDMLVAAGALIYSWYLAVYRGYTPSPGLVDYWLNMSKRAYKALELALGGDNIISKRLTMFSKHLAYVEELEQEAPQTIKECTTWPQQGIIEFKDYSMQYRADAGLVLNKLAFITKPGEKIGIVGRTGAGKSSLTFALLRLVEAANGSIYIDGVDISTLGLSDLRSSIAMVPQDPMILPGTIRDNLDPGNEYTDADIQLALEKTGIWPILDNQLTTWVNSTSFSAGQRQLLSLSRALLWNRKIVILDEATANIDSTTDQLIQQLIKHEFAQSTVLTIAHRLHTVMDSDRILVMSQGQVAEFDTPQALLQQPDSQFKQMVDSMNHNKQVLDST